MGIKFTVRHRNLSGACEDTSTTTIEVGESNDAIFEAALKYANLRRLRAPDVVQVWLMGEDNKVNPMEFSMADVSVYRECARGGKDMSMAEWSVVILAVLAIALLILELVRAWMVTP